MTHALAPHADRRDVVVVGAGFGGLAAAVRLQAAGHRVTLVDQRSQLGGRAGQLQSQGYTFDTGPTIITATSLFRELWLAAGSRLEDDLQLIPLTPYYDIAFADGRTFAYGGSPEQVEAEIARFSPRDVAGYRRLLEATGGIYEQAFTRLGRQPFLSVRDFLRVAPQLLRYGAARSVWGYVGQYLHDPALRLAYSFHPLFIGGNPFRASAIYSIIPYLEAKEGVWYARGGMHALVEAIGRLLTRLGGQVRLGDGVEQIQLSTFGEALPRVIGVRLQSGVELRADVVVSNADPAWTYEYLLPHLSQTEHSRDRMRRYRYSMSCFLLYLGLDRQYPHLAHHTVVMPRDFRHTVQQIFRGEGLPDELAAYVNVPSRTDPSLAPPGGEVLYVLVPVPNLRTGLDWGAEAGPFRNRVLRLVSDRLGLDDLEQHIVTEHRYTPMEFRDQLSSPLGAAFSIEPILGQSASFRPGNRAPDVGGLYFVGAGTHPGAGLPGVLISAEITSNLVERDPARLSHASPRVVRIARLPSEPLDGESPLAPAEIGS